MKSTLRARTPIIALAFIGMAVLFIAACTTNEVEIPGLTGPSGARLFITIEASPDKVFIRGPKANPNTSRITLQLRNQLGEGVPNARIAVRITNVEGSEVSIGNLDHLTVVTDSGGFARVTYTAPSTSEQPVPVTVFIRAILTDPAYAFEVVSSHALDLQLAKPFDCVGGPGSPDIQFTFSPTSPAEDEQVCFDAQGTTDNGGIISFTWDFGDGNTDSGAVVCHTYRSQGQFQVTLTVIDGDANCVSLTQLINVGAGGAPTCTFTVSPNPVNTDTNVLFNASASTDADGDIVSYSWNFGDGNSGSGETTSHSFSTPGAFTVTLTVRDNAGNESTCTQTVTVATGIPTCDFDIDPNPAAVGETVTFDASASTDPDGGNLTFSWDLDGNGSFESNGQIVTRTYNTPGVVVISLRVFDEEGNETTCTQSLTIGNTAPVCESFTADPSGTIEPGTIVDFTVIASDPDAGDVLSVQFTTTGGTPGGSIDPAAPFEHSATYNNVGTFTANATVRDDSVPAGTTACPPITITVEEPDPVVPNITISDTAVTEGDTGTTANLVFTVSLSEPTTQNVTVNFTTSDGTATVLDGDYIASTSAITITPGNTSAPITIIVNGDDDDENNETMAVTLTSATGGTIVDPQGIGTINDDDP